MNTAGASGWEVKKKVWREPEASKTRSPCGHVQCMAKSPIDR